MNNLYALLVMLMVCLPGMQQSFAQKPDPDKQYKLLQKAIERYESLQARADWPEIPGNRSGFRLNDRNQAIQMIRERLTALGDLRKGRFFSLRKSPASDVYSNDLADAVKRFQLRHGLKDDGIAGPAVIKALNVPLDVRINQLRINIDRLLTDTSSNSGKHIIVNIPAYRLYVYEDRNEVLAMDIVVGKSTNQTVVFSDEIEHVVFSPYWNVPPGIVKNEILPSMAKNSRYLRSQGMEITGNENGLPVIRQKPGPKNALGKVKFMFPNKYNIYFHDTPAKSLFSREARAFSHGCIRLSEPFELASYLLKDQPGWDDESIRKAMNSGTEKWVALDQPVPVSISYYTAWVDAEGTVHFRDDIYGYDKEASANAVY